MKIHSESNEDYLEAILVLEKGGKTRSVDISEMLNVSRAAVAKATNELQINGYIEKELYGTIILTKKGREIAKNVYDKHQLLYKWLVSIGVSEDVANEDCCRIEHIISDETLNCIKKEYEKKGN